MIEETEADNADKDNEDNNIDQSSNLNIINAPNPTTLQVATSQPSLPESAELTQYELSTSSQDNSQPKIDSRPSAVSIDVNDESKNDTQNDKSARNTPDSATSPQSFNYGYSFESNYNGLTKIHENIIEEEEEEQEQEDEDDVDITALAMAQLQMQIQAGRKASDATIDEDARSDITQLSNYTVKDDNNALKNEDVPASGGANDDHDEVPLNALDTIAEGEEDEEEGEEIEKSNLSKNKDTNSTFDNSRQYPTLTPQFSGASSKLTSLSTQPYQSDDVV